MVAPDTPNVPPNIVAPFPTVKVLPAAILTLSFRVVAPVTANVPVPVIFVADTIPNVVAPVTPNVPVPVIFVADTIPNVVASVTDNVPVIPVFPADTEPNVVAPVTSNVPVSVIFVAVILLTDVTPFTVKLLPTVDVPEVDMVVNEPDAGLLSPTLPSIFAFIVPTEPENTLEVSVASGI